MRSCVLLIALCMFACGDPVESSNNEPDAGDAQNNTANNQNNQTQNNTNSNNSVQDCEPLQDTFIDSVRALPRDCTSDAECSLALRSGPCDCAIAVNATQPQLATFGAARQALDDAQCRNPFVCVGNMCSQYNTLSDPGELLARCVGNECEVTQVMSCADFEAKKYGGIISESNCVTDDDCTVRTNLNPCDCPEAVSVTFPALAIEPIGELIRINEARCGTTCDMACPTASTPVCVDLGDVKRCRLN